MKRIDNNTKERYYKNDKDEEIDVCFVGCRYGHGLGSSGVGEHGFFRRR